LDHGGSDLIYGWHGWIHLWIHNVMGYWKAVESLGGGASLEEVGHWEQDFEVGLFCLAPFLSLSASQPHEVSSFAPLCVFHHNVLPYHKPKSQGAKQPLTESSETTSQSKLSSLRWFFSGICHSNGKLTNALTYFSNLLILSPACSNLLSF
jgi:hypothetical protein